MLAQEFKSFLAEQWRQQGHPGNVAGWPVQVRNKTSRDWIKPTTNTVGIAEVAALAEKAELPPVATTTATCRRTNSLASAGS